MKIVLIGYRAAGKSTLGRLISQRLDWPLLDIDRGIEVRSGKTLKQLYEGAGDDHFRTVESEVVTEMCDQDRCVIAFGAGSLIRKQNRIAACTHSLVVYLEAPVEALWHRIQTDPHSLHTRPNLSRGGIEEVVEMLALREPVYRECADLTLDATLPPEHLAEKVIVAYNDRDGTG